MRQQISTTLHRCASQPHTGGESFQCRAVRQRLEGCRQGQRVNGAGMEQRVPDKPGVVGRGIVGRRQSRRKLGQQGVGSSRVPGSAQAPHQLLARLGVEFRVNRQHLLVLHHRFQRRRASRQTDRVRGMGCFQQACHWQTNR